MILPGATALSQASARCEPPDLARTRAASHPPQPVASVMFRPKALGNQLRDLPATFF